MSASECFRIANIRPECNACSPVPRDRQHKRLESPQRHRAAGRGRLEGLSALLDQVDQRCRSFIHASKHHFLDDYLPYPAYFHGMVR